MTADKKTIEKSKTDDSVSKVKPDISRVRTSVERVDMADAEGSLGTDSQPSGDSKSESTHPLKGIRPDPQRDQGMEPRSKVKKDS
jgi:hypothetical protein